MWKNYLMLAGKETQVDMEKLSFIYPEPCLYLGRSFVQCGNKAKKNFFLMQRSLSTSKQAKNLK